MSGTDKQDHQLTETPSGENVPLRERFSPSGRSVTRAAVAAAAVLSLTFLLAVSTEGSGGAGPVVWLLVSTLILVLVGGVVMTVSSSSLDANRLSAAMATEPDAQRLLRRWLTRTGWFRNLGGTCGVVLGLMVGTNGLDGVWILVLGTAGVMVGSMLAELHRVRGDSGPRTAALEPRSVGDYLGARDKRRTVGLVALWIGVAVWALVDSEGRGALPFVIIAAAIILSTWWFQRRVASRPRPGLAAGLRRADDLARELAITRSLAQPSNVVLLALLIPAVRRLDSIDADTVGFLSVGIFLVAFWWWRSNRRLGLDWLVDQHPAAPSGRLAS